MHWFTRCKLQPCNESGNIICYRILFTYFWPRKNKNKNNRGPGSAGKGTAPHWTCNLSRKHQRALNYNPATLRVSIVVILLWCMFALVKTKQIKLAHNWSEERECSVNRLQAARVEQVSDCSPSTSCVSIFPSRILQVQLVLLSGAGTHSNHMRDSRTSVSGETSFPSSVAKLNALIEIFY